MSRESSAVASEVSNATAAGLESMEKVSSISSSTVSTSQSSETLCPEGDMYRLRNSFFKVPTRKKRSSTW